MNAQFLNKIPNVGHHLSPGNVKICCKDSNSSLLECFLTFLRCIRMIGRAYNSISDPRLVNQLYFYQMNPQISSKITNFRHHLSPCSMVMCLEESHPLLLECFLTFLRCIRMIGRSSDSISDPLLVNTLSFLPN